MPDRGSHRNVMFMKTQPLHVHLLPDLIPAETLAGGTAIVIDVLRASTTIATALNSGVASVIPCQSPEEAFALRAELSGENVLLGGERGGIRIEGFDRGNSPAEYTPEVVSGRTLVFTTTNGTRALQFSLEASSILTGGFINRAAVVRRLLRDEQPVHLVCAGTDRQVTGEDVLYAGCLVSGLQQADSAAVQWALNDSAQLALRLWQSVVDGASCMSAAIEEYLLTTQGGRNLIRIGCADDPRLCAQLDLTDIVPEYDRDSGRIMAPREC